MFKWPCIRWNKPKFGAKYFIMWMLHFLRSFISCLGRLYLLAVTVIIYIIQRDIQTSLFMVARVLRQYVSSELWWTLLKESNKKSQIWLPIPPVLKNQFNRNKKDFLRASYDFFRSDGCQQQKAHWSLVKALSRNLTRNSFVCN